MKTPKLIYNLRQQTRGATMGLGSSVKEAEAADELMKYLATFHCQECLSPANEGHEEWCRNEEP